MYLLSDVSFVSGLIAKTLRAARSKYGLSIVAAAFASLMLTLSTGVHAQSQNPDNTPPEQAQIIHNQVDINTADAATLALALDGVGMAKAHDIIAYREQNGDFKTADDLQKVRGIGKATLERNRSRILVTPVEE
ncbi:MAG: helix-hairpin-helix domain-containing protein [Pseudohongiella sp.]|nr:helix-hairpin-helix domain-containing protein [Pseudohongiella sp.]